MDRTDEIEKIEKNIKDSQTRLKTLRNNIEALDSEIKKIATFERTLVENVKTLKKQQVVAIAKEFGNAKAELKRVRARLVTLKNDKEHFAKVFKDAFEFLKNTQIQYDKIMQQGENNVIRFRREDGKK